MRKLPLVLLLPSRGNEVGVAWDVRDDNFDANKANAIELEYRAPGAVAWQPLFRLPGASQHYWAPGTAATLEVRIRARDLAGNTTEATTQVSLANTGGAGGQQFYPGDGQDNAGASALDPDRRFLNTKRIVLNYTITEQGPSGLSGID